MNQPIDPRQPHIPQGEGEFTAPHPPHPPQAGQGQQEQAAAQGDPRVPPQGRPCAPAPPAAAPAAPPAQAQDFPIAPPAQAPGSPTAPPAQPQGYPTAPPAQAPAQPAGPPPQPYAAPAQAPPYAPGPFATPPHSSGFQATGAPSAPPQGQVPGYSTAPPVPPTLAKPEPVQAPPVPGAAPAYPPAAYDPAQPPAYDPGAPPPIRRGADASSVTTLLLHLPLFVGSLVVVWLVSRLLPAGLDVVFVVAWLASGALMFHRPTERALARLMFKVREPTAAELARLRPIWDEVTGQAGIDGSRYDLWVEDSRHINAFAAAGHIVSVTRTSLNGLPEEELAAVLAHELGHHVGGHAWAGLLGVWYAFPARFVMGIVKFFMKLVFMVAAEGTSCVAAILTLLIFALAITFALTFPPALALLAVPFLLAWAGRRGELRADRFAAEIGYGPQLHAAFTFMQNDKEKGGADDGRLQQGLVERLMATHPPMHQRIRGLDPFITLPGGPVGPTGGLPS
ncbi:M48 family metalloprotease [Streptomyces sp. NPDC093801]|uniref:M48 family metalloprotease n=1 Tax=Streptomyces sp. NPDC093801 TaxID=3155203 RepID=UPI00344B0E74